MNQLRLHRGARTLRAPLAIFVLSLLAAGTLGCPRRPFGGFENSAILCADGVDNDGDFLSDCLDQDCAPFCMGGSDSGVPLNCGDGTCDMTSESCASCPGDCGPCAGCGDGTCGPGEDCASCVADCGMCPPSCPNGACDASETCTSCPADCGTCGPVCGNGSCEAGETCSTCVADCGMCMGPGCGDGSCNAASGEDCTTCMLDCGGCGNCGDGFCNFGEAETCASCTADCSCGAGTCFDFINCVGPCTDGLCQEACWEATCLTGQTQYNNLGFCASAMCFDECYGPGGDPTTCNSCANTMCGPEIGACMTGGC